MEREKAGGEKGNENPQSSGASERSQPWMGDDR